MIDTKTPAAQRENTAPDAPKILFADDEEDLREFIETTLLDEGYRIQAACDGREAVTMFGEFQPDLVILDVHMPLMNGTDACAIIRKISDVPIIMFTSAGDIDNVNGAINNGTTDFVLKSTGIAELADRVASQLAKRNKRVQTVIGSSVVQVTAAIPEPFTSITLIVEPDKAIRDHLTAILTKLSQDFIEVETADEAIAAIKQHDPDIVISEWMLQNSNAAKMLADSNQGRKGRKPIPIVISSRLSPEIQRKLKFSGIDKILSVPLDLWKTEVMIAECVKQARTRLKREASKAA